MPPLQFFSKFQFPLAIVAHDAGAMNHIVEWVKDLDHDHIRVCLTGPALDIWKRAFPYSNISNELESALANVAMLISGTGWQSCLEHNARKMACHLGIKVVAVVDHWTNYRERFVRDGAECLPDEIWVTDNHATEMVKRIFPDLQVIQMPNFYLDAQVREVLFHAQSYVSGSKHNLLYVLEPIRDAWGVGIVAGEFDALDFFMRNLGAIGLADEVTIRLRPHPSDTSGKYNAWISAQSVGRIILDDMSTLAESIAWSDVVVGCQTYAMVIALASGKKVFSSIPPYAPSCVLPQAGIVSLSRLISVRLIQLGRSSK